MDAPMRIIYHPHHRTGIARRVHTRYAAPCMNKISSKRMHMQEATPLSRNTPLLVVVSLDVEEEGLFSGHYASTGGGVRNVALLRRLVPLTTELGFPLSLLCTHTVFAHTEACHVLAHMRDNVGAEIGAHLHHWSTPPFEDGVDSAPDPYAPPRHTHTLPREFLRARLRSLLEAGRHFQGAPLTSFRMGRWDLKDVVRPLLAEEGIWVDSSVCPLRFFAEKHGYGPDHFGAPPDPYWPVQADGTSPLLEAPITQVPLHPWLAKGWHALMADRPGRDAFRTLGALSPNPVWHSMAVMRIAARLHVARGGRVLNLFWHSSEMLPGASPHTPDQAAADALIKKIFDYLVWLRATWRVRGVTLSSLYGEKGFPHLPASARTGDW